MKTVNKTISFEFGTVGGEAEVSIRDSEQLAKWDTPTVRELSVEDLAVTWFGGENYVHERKDRPDWFAVLGKAVGRKLDEEKLLAEVSI